MQKIKALILALLAVVCLPLAVAQKTIYIETFGGPQGVCDGSKDTAPVGTNPGQQCALNDLRYIEFWNTNGYTLVNVPLIAAGDTVNIGAGTFSVGYSGPNPNDHNGLAQAGNPFSTFADLPAGVTIQGQGSGKTVILGRFGTYAIFAANASNITLRGLHLTTVSQCSRLPGDAQCSNAYPVSDYAKYGIITSTGANGLVLDDVKVDGFLDSGIRGAIGGTVTATNVEISFNAMAGWNFDDGSSTASINNPQVSATGLKVWGNGCAKEYPIVHSSFPARHCAGDGNGGYGDGIGTPATALGFTCDHCDFHYNTQDGFDFLHTTGGVIQITHSQSYGNMGQQWKMGAPSSVVFTDNKTVHNCKRMSVAIGGNSTFGTDLGGGALGPFCRAANESFALSVNDNGTYLIQNNSFAGYQATTYDIGCYGGPCTKGVITHTNNLYIGYPSPIDGQQPGWVWSTLSGVNPLAQSDHNVYYNFRAGAVPTETGSVTTDPKIAAEPAYTAETDFDAIDFHLTAASTNAIGDAGPSSEADDYDGLARLKPTSIGAFETASAPPPPPPPPPPTITPYVGTINPTPITIPAQTITVPVLAQTISVPVPAQTITVTARGKATSATIPGYTLSYTVPASSVTGTVPGQTVTPSPVGINCSVVGTAVTCATK